MKKTRKPSFIAIRKVGDDSIVLAIPTKGICNSLLLNGIHFLELALNNNYDYWVDDGCYRVDTATECSQCRYSKAGWKGWK